MLGPGRYLLGVVEILLLGGFAWLGGSALRRWLLPRFQGAPAGLASAVIALALLIWCAELLGSFGAFEPLPYLLLVALTGLACWRLAPRPPERGEPHLYLPSEVRLPSLRHGQRRNFVLTLIALAIAALAVIHFAAGVKTRLSTGMTGFDSTWYHGPFAAGFFQSGDTWDLHFIAPQFLAWFYPANSELFHAVGMLAFGRDVLSPLLNLGWFVGCLVACWCIGRPYRVGPWSLALGALALSVPALADQAGEARNDVVGIFFLLAAVAIALNAASRERQDEAPPAGGTVGGAIAEEAPAAGRHGEPLAATGAAGRAATLGPALVVGLAAGLAAGTKLNFLPPAAVLVVGLALIAPRGERSGAFVASALAALAGGGYWYLRNLVHTGNPLPWVHHLGPVDLPAPQQALGGREAHSVLSYLTDGSVWSHWFLPGLHRGLWPLWPLLLAAAGAGLFLALASPLRRRAEKSNPVCRRADLSTDGGQIGPSAGVGGLFGPSARVLAVAGAVGLAAALAWLVSPTSASGPDGMPRGFESGLRYLAPALILGLALLPAAPRIRVWLSFDSDSATKLNHTLWEAARRRAAPGVFVGAGTLAALTLIVVGYPVQRHYLQSRYEDPSFTSPGLNAAFAWARDVDDARIATTSTRQYPLYGTDLSNKVKYLGIHRPHGGFEAPISCQQYLRLLDEGEYDYVVATRDRIEAGKPPYPPLVRWLQSAGAHPILRKPPTVVFKLPPTLDPSACS
ncbi:MAG TPA: hypothetical protein VFK14_02350 [Solirubrobacterales bacterium]|nr:hypothetical protein [Solirubrobacterales bacterium]